MLAVIVAVYFAVIVGLTMLMAKFLSRGWIRAALSIVAVALAPLGISLLAFPIGSGGGVGIVILTPLLWIVGFAGVTAANLLDTR